MGKIVALLVLAVVGCAGQAPSGTIGPDAASQERALQLVWEGTYGMSVDSRPSITWSLSDADEYSTPGDMHLQWNGTTISDTHFSAWLEGEREWIVYPNGTLAPQAEVNRLTGDAQKALIAAGL